MSAGSRSDVDSAPRRLMPVLFIGVFMSALDTAVIAPAIPALRASFGIDNREVGLMMIVFILFSLSSTALMANLSDRHGRRPVYLGSVACFALGSLIIALAPHYGLVLLGRAVQGVGGGGIIPIATAVIGDTFAPKDRGRALGLIGATYGMAFMLGPPLAGLLMLALSWHWIFLANLPVAAVVLVLGARALPARPPSAARPPLDVAGIAVVFVLLTCLVLGITCVADGFAGERLWPWFLAAVVALVPLLVHVERRAASPMIPLSLFARRQLVTAYLLTIGAGFGMGSVIFLTSIATLAHAVAADRAGFVLVPLVICSMLGSMGAGRALHRVGARSVVLTGFAMLALGYGASAFTGQGLAGFIVASMPVGLGVGIVVGGALRSIAIDESPAAVRGSAQGLINICTSIGTLLSAATIGALADFGGGGAAGFGLAYTVVAVAMLAMFGLTLALQGGNAARGPAAGDEAEAALAPAGPKAGAGS